VAATATVDNATPQDAQAAIAAMMLMVTLALALSLASIWLHVLVPRHQSQSITSGYLPLWLRQGLCRCRGGGDNSATIASAAARRQSLLAMAQVQSFRGKTGGQLQPARRRASRGASVVQDNPSSLVSARPRASLAPAAFDLGTRMNANAQDVFSSAPTVNPLLTLQRSSRGTIVRDAPVTLEAGRVSRETAAASSGMSFRLPPTRHTLLVSTVRASGVATSPDDPLQGSDPTSTSSALVRLTRGSDTALSFAAGGSQQRALPSRSRVFLPPPSS
jgi:hypothetical protein